MGRIRGRARVLDDGDEAAAALAALTAKYPQYHEAPPGPPVLGDRRRRLAGVVG